MRERAIGCEERVALAGRRTGEGRAVEGGGSGQVGWGSSATVSVVLIRLDSVRLGEGEAWGLGEVCRIRVSLLSFLVIP